MLAKKITYTDFDGTERTETFYFNLSRSEITVLQLTYPGGYAQYIERTVDSNDQPKIMEMFQDIIRRSYGEKSEDGKRLMKSPELSKGFMETNAYDNLFIELCTVPDAAMKFIAGVLPDFGDDKAQKERLIQEAVDKANRITKDDMVVSSEHTVSSSE